MRGIGLIAAERHRQITVEGWDSIHDDSHEYATLAVVAAELCVDGTDATIQDGMGREDIWGLTKKHRANRVRQLTIAGALIAAEIDRQIRREREH